MGENLNRRGFLRKAATASLGLAIPYAVSARALGAEGKAGANDRLTVGFIGCGGISGFHFPWALGNKRVEVVAVCDVDTERRLAAQQRVGNGCAEYSDYRSLLDRDDIDAVFVLTPDHWHTLIATNACEAGKDVYCEKPLTLSIEEAYSLINTVRRYGRVFQTGSQQRSSWEFRHACELVRNGYIGKVDLVRVGIGGAPQSDLTPDSAPPPGLNWNMWLGPAPYSPFNSLRHPYNFRWFYDYSGGKMTDWGAHHNDIAQWGLGKDGTQPVLIEGTATFPTAGIYDTATTFDIHYTHDTGQRVICSSDGAGVTFEGSEGKIHVDRGVLETEPAELRDMELAPGDLRLYNSPEHHENWFQCIQTRERPICDVEISAGSVIVCHLGNIAIRLGRAIQWDPATRRVVGDEEANRWLSRPYRAPWHL
jgi:predicted dehydrogenase